MISFLKTIKMKLLVHNVSPVINDKSSICESHTNTSQQCTEKMTVIIDCTWAQGQDMSILHEGGLV